MDHILGAHFAENFCESLIAIDRDVVLNVAGVNLADVFEDDTNFFFFWFAQFFIGNVAHLSFVLMKLATFDEVFHHDLTDSSWG